MKSLPPWPDEIRHLSSDGFRIVTDICHTCSLHLFFPPPLFLSSPLFPAAEEKKKKIQASAEEACVLNTVEACTEEMSAQPRPEHSALSRTHEMPFLHTPRLLYVYDELIGNINAALGCGRGRVWNWVGLMGFWCGDMAALMVHCENGMACFFLSGRA